MSIPGHMARGVTERDLPERIDARTFRIGPARFGYGQWGLHLLT